MKRYFFGEWKERTGPLDLADIEKLCDQAEAAREAMANYPLDKVLSLLARVGEAWKNPNYPGRLKLLKELPQSTRFSKEMIEKGLGEMSWVCETENLQRKLQTELSGNSREAWKYDPDTNTSTRFEPLGVVLHVLSGNVFLVGLGSLVEGLLTGNVNILKMSSEETLFVPLLIQSICECDKEGVISRSIAVIDYSSSQKEVIALLKNRVDGIVVWGGEEAVRAYRNDLPARTKILVFGPKLSLSVVTQATAKQVETAGQRLAQEIAIWDQNACTAPQLCFVESRALSEKLLEATAQALRQLNRSLPPGPAETHTAAEIQKLRGKFDIAESREQGRVVRSEEGVDWTLFLDLEKEIEPSPLHRTLRIVPVESISQVQAEMEKLRGYIQTVGLFAEDSQWPELSAKLLRSGALRVVPLGTQSGGEIDEPHDGVYDLPQLGHLVFARGGKSLDPVDFIPRASREKLVEHSLRTLLVQARKSPFYAKRLEGIEVGDLSQLSRIPILTRDDMDSNMPPQSEGLKTKDYVGGYVSRSGGSTGAPKFSIYDGQDWEALVSNAVRVLRAAGLEKGDRIANCMLAGDLYGSFVSFDHINCRIGATTFAFAGQLEPETFLEIWRRFKINAIEAMPTVLMPLLRVAKQMAHDFQLEKVIYAGIPLSLSDREWIEKNIGPKSICSVVGANDGGQFAYQCQFQRGHRHHVTDDFNYVEIVDEQGQPVQPGQSGRILITSLLKFAFPLIRYDIGDAARWVEEPCVCGRTSRVIEYMGRSDDMVCVGLLNLRYRDVVQAIQGQKYSVLQLVAKANDLGESVELRIETDESGPEFKSGFEKQLLDNLPPLRDALREGHLNQLTIQVYPTGALPRNPRTGKVKLLCDERF